MRTSAHCAAAIAAILLSLTPFPRSSAQTAITYTDIMNAYAVGQMRIEYLTPANQTVTLPIGKPSTSPQTWDFSALPFEQSATSEFVDPGDAPYTSLFAAANVVRRTLSRAISEAMYQYNQLATNAFSLHGYFVEGDAAPYICSPPIRQIKLPCALGSSWTHTADPAHPSPDVTVIVTRYFVVDAQGTLKIPGGAYPALRLRCETVTETRTPSGSALLTEYRFSYITPEMISVTVAVDSVQAGQAEAQATGVGMEKPAGPVGVQGAPGASERAFLDLYPSPLQAGRPALIRFSLPRPGAADIVLYTPLGKEAARFAVGDAQAGANILSFSTAALPAGCCLCVVRSGNTRTAGRIIVLK